MSERRKDLARYGPYHRRCSGNPNEIRLVAESKELRGRARRNIYAGAIAAAKAWNGPLPAGVVGYEFYTEVAPDPDCAPDWPEWSEGRPGVRIIKRNELVAIDIVVTKLREPD
jgi:hypothetical protein